MDTDTVALAALIVAIIAFVLSIFAILRTLKRRLPSKSLKGGRPDGWTFDEFETRRFEEDFPKLHRLLISNNPITPENIPTYGPGDERLPESSLDGGHHDWTLMENLIYAMFHDSRAVVESILGINNSSNNNNNSGLSDHGVLKLDEICRMLWVIARDLNINNDYENPNAAPFPASYKTRLMEAIRVYDTMQPGFRDWVDVMLDNRRIPNDWWGSGSDWDYGDSSSSEWTD